MEPKDTEVKMNRAQRRAAAKAAQKEWTKLKYSANMSDLQFRMLITRVIRGQVSQQEWGKMSKALQKRIEDFLGDLKDKVQNNPEFLKQLPSNAIIKEIKLDNEEAAPEENSNQPLTNDKK